MWMEDFDGPEEPKMKIREMKIAEGLDIAFAILIVPLVAGVLTFFIWAFGAFVMWDAGWLSAKIACQKHYDATVDPNP